MLEKITFHFISLEIEKGIWHDLQIEVLSFCVRLLNVKDNVYRQYLSFWVFPLLFVRPVFNNLVLFNGVYGAFYSSMRLSDSDLEKMFTILHIKVW